MKTFEIWDCANKLLIIKTDTVQYGRSPTLFLGAESVHAPHVHQFKACF